MKRRHLLKLGLMPSLVPSLAWAKPQSADALTRPAQPVRQPARAVLLGASTAGTRVVAVGERGLVALSDDAGAHWRQAPVPTSVTLTTVRFADARRGFAVGHGGIVLASEDGGESWTRVLDGHRIATLEVETARAGTDTAALKAAERLQSDGPDKPLLDLLVLDPQRVRVVGAYGLALASDDGGRTWQSWRMRLPNPREAHLYALRRRGDTWLVAGEQGVVLSSNDDGRSFQRLTLPYAGSFFTAELLAAQTLLVAGLRGNVWRSTDGGGAWSPLPVPVPAGITASAFTPDGRLLLASQAGLVLVAKGEALAPLPGAPLPPLNALLPLEGGRVLALTTQGTRLLTP
ncbi:MAG: YCF48-related protein [Sphaerotilus natans subsp. sulfidivorans]|uniref:WD40/YVTN/BNR-like repeat-containing protein n=1 Tax=Sphaerotilus sulfidivorans TaxID=639200 RepID=UPI0023560F3D|nr:YCF48-related protein [Sphaerotilus sulfidivorans]MCK6401338.1 YCF48-related protein [Sphaerotilus sulfidivorans]